MNNMVSWKDYDGVEGFHMTTQDDVDDLNKALSAGQEINKPAVAPGQGFALRVESLENTLKNLTYKADHIKFWKNIPKLPAYNTVEEHNQIDSYGQNPDSGFMAEGDLPEEDDSQFERKYAIVKFLGTTRKVTHVMSVVKPAHGNVITQETVNGTMHLMKILERALFYGRSDLSALQFDGYEKLLQDNSPASNIIDLRGLPLSEDILSDACLTALDAPNYGQITHAYMNPKVQADLSKTFFPKERHGTFTDKSGIVGNHIKGFMSPAGEVAFQPDTFIDDGGPPNAAAVGDSSKIPGTPTVSTGPTSPGASNPLFTADDAGNYFYEAVAVNRYGRSAPVAVGGGAVAVSALDKVTFGLTPAGANAVDWYAIYRTEKNGADGSERLILRVPNGAGVGEQIIDDLNAELPYTTSVFLFQQNLESISFKQLAPMVKIPLATIDSSIRWMQLIYGTPVLYAPGKNVLLKNVGRAANYVGAA